MDKIELKNNHCALYFGRRTDILITLKE